LSSRPAAGLAGASPYIDPKKDAGISHSHPVIGVYANVVRVSCWHGVWLDVDSVNNMSDVDRVNNVRE
jgi:hypothetical protein